MGGKSFQRSSSKSLWEQESPVFLYFTTILAVFPSLRSSRHQAALLPSPSLWKHLFPASVPVTWQFLLPCRASKFVRFGKKGTWPCSGGSEVKMQSGDWKSWDLKQKECFFILYVVRCRYRNFFGREGFFPFPAVFPICISICFRTMLRVQVQLQEGMLWVFSEAGEMLLQVCHSCATPNPGVLC